MAFVSLRPYLASADLNKVIIVEATIYGDIKSEGIIICRLFLRSYRVWIHDLKEYWFPGDPLRTSKQLIIKAISTQKQSQSFKKSEDELRGANFPTAMIVLCIFYELVLRHFNIILWILMNAFYKIDRMVVSLSARCYSIRIGSCNQECDSFPFMLAKNYWYSSFFLLFPSMPIRRIALPIYGIASHHSIASFG